MNWGYVLLITMVTTLLLLIVQRTESTRRRLAAVLVALCLLVIRHNAFIKADLHEETLIAFALGLLFSGIFWLLIGRYNPVGSSDDIKVMGLDD